MKSILISLLIVFCMLSNSMHAASYKYYFFYNLKEKAGTGPDLISQCTPTYTWETMPGGFGKSVDTFDKGCGLVFNDSLTSFLSTGTYTIEIYFRLDTTTGYKKLIDFNNLTADAGLYNFNGKLNLYPSFSSDSLMGPNTYQYVALTRDNASKKMYIYHNNTVAGSYNDSTDKYIYGVNKRLIFFRDDTGTGNEQTGGAVALVAISNTAMDSTSIKNNYNGLVGTLLNIPSTNTDDIVLYPNPVVDNLYVTTTLSYSYSLLNITGVTLIEHTLDKGDNKISMDNFPSGIYLLKVASKDGNFSKTYFIQKQ